MLYSLCVQSIAFHITTTVLHAIRQSCGTTRDSRSLHSPRWHYVFVLCNARDFQMWRVPRDQLAIVFPSNDRTSSHTSTVQQTQRCSRLLTLKMSCKYLCGNGIRTLDSQTVPFPPVVMFTVQSSPVQHTLNNVNIWRLKKASPPLSSSFLSQRPRRVSCSRKLQNV